MSKVPLPAVKPKRRPSNKERIVGQKRPLLPKQVWAIRAPLEPAGNLRDLTLFNFAIDSKLPACDRVRLKVADLVARDRCHSPGSRPHPRLTPAPVNSHHSGICEIGMMTWPSCHSSARVRHPLAISVIAA